MPKPRRPTSLRIGWATWKVRWLTDKQWAKQAPDHPDEGGLTYTGCLEIWVRKHHAMSEDMMREVLLHEILHAAVATAAVGPALGRVKKRDIEETAVAAIAGPLLGALRDNPGLADYLRAA